MNLLFHVRLVVRQRCRKQASAMGKTGHMVAGSGGELAMRNLFPECAPEDVDKAVDFKASGAKFSISRRLRLIRPNVVRVALYTL